MTINKKTVAALLDVLQRAASQLEGDFGAEDAMANELRDMHRMILGVNAGVSGPRPSQEKLMDGRPAREKWREKSRQQAMSRPRDSNGHFIKMM